MTSRQPQLSIAVAQLCSTDQPESNHQQCLNVLQNLDHRQIDCLSFPENMWHIRDTKDDKQQQLDCTAFIADLQSFAQRTHTTIHIGSFPEPSPNGHQHYNTSCIIHSDGTIGPRYRKRHLFSLNSTSEQLYESTYCLAGNSIVTDTIAGWRIGHSICYDLRFPEHYRSMAAQGMDIAFVPAAFTCTTGPVHWETLLRARAIENQCYVVAAAQCGQHTRNRASYGHSLIIDPWGDIQAQADNTPTIITATLSSERIESVRRTLPALRDRHG